jgi:hypothetical protein
MSVKSNGRDAVTASATVNDLLAACTVLVLLVQTSCHDMSSLTIAVCSCYE